MKTLRKCLVAAALIAGGTLYAQTPPAPTPDPAPTGPVDVSAKATIKLSVGETTARVIELEAQVRADSQHVQHLQAQARKEKDVIKLSCVNDKMVKLKAEANLFDKSRGELTAVLETDGRHAALASVEGGAAKVRKLREEADGCSGKIELEPTDTGNTFQPPVIPDDPTTGGLPFDDNGHVFEPPVYASPYS